MEISPRQKHMFKPTAKDKLMDWSLSLPRYDNHDDNEWENLYPGLLTGFTGFMQSLGRDMKEPKTFSVCGIGPNKIITYMPEAPQPHREYIYVNFLSGTHGIRYKMNSSILNSHRTATAVRKGHGKSWITWSQESF